MQRYRRAWVSCSTLLGVTCVALGILLWSVSEVVLVAAVPALMIGLATACSHLPEDGPVNWLRVVRRIATAGLCFVTATVLLSTGAAGWAVLGLVVATCPWVIASARCLVQSDEVAPPGVAPQGEPDIGGGPWAPSASVPTDRLTDHELCRQWRASYWLLQDARGPVQGARVAALRQAYLDEIERRNPAAFESWLASNPRATNGMDRWIGLS